LRAAPERDAEVDGPDDWPVRELGGKGCGAIVSLLLEQEEPGYGARIGEVEVTGARVKGDRAVALIEIEASPEEVIPVRQEGGSWKVAAFAGSDIP
jgi:hypothetical protein